MTDPQDDPFRGLLSGFSLGPAWARGDAETASGKATRQRDRARPTRDSPAVRDGEGRPPRDDRRAGGRDARQGGGGRGRFRDDVRQRRVEIQPAEHVRVNIRPAREAIHLIGKEIHQVARTYSLFDIAVTVLAEKSRCEALFEVRPSAEPLWHCLREPALFVSREEALSFFWQAEWRTEFVEEETIQCDPPTGNFQSVARCGISGVWLGPPNFHSYQPTLRRIHREQFPNMPFEAYAARVRTERGEEAVNEWLESTKTRQRWRLKDAGDEAWTQERAEMDRLIVDQVLPGLFERTMAVAVPANLDAVHLSPSLNMNLRFEGGYMRDHPATMIPALCKVLEMEHLPVFKVKGKLFTGPSRPHPLELDAVLAERPAVMVEWIRANPPAKLAGLWEAVLPEGGTAPPAEFAADLFWLLTRGHILLFTDDKLVVQDVRPAATPADDAAKPPKKKRKRKSKRGKGEGIETTPGAPTAETAEAAEISAGDGDPAVSAESAQVESNATEAPASLAKPATPDSEIRDADSAELNPATPSSPADGTAAIPGSEPQMPTAEAPAEQATAQATTGEPVAPQSDATSASASERLNEEVQIGEPTVALERVPHPAELVPTEPAPEPPAAEAATPAEPKSPENETTS